MKMNLRTQVITLTVIFVAFTVVESSILVKHSLLQPRLPEPCFACRSEDRPYSYSIISYLASIKDMVVRGLNALVASSKEHKLDFKNT